MYNNFRDAVLKALASNTALTWQDVLDVTEPQARAQSFAFIKQMQNEGLVSRSVERYQNSARGQLVVRAGGD